MSFVAEHRGVSQVIGAVILFGFLIVALSTWQAVGVPNQNSQTEFGAYLEAQEDMVQLRSDIIASATRGIDTSSTVQTGVRYPSRIFAINPPPPQGQLATGASQNLTFSNITAVSSEASNTVAFWSGVGGVDPDDGEIEYQNLKTGLVFTPDYNEIDGSQIVTTGQSSYLVGEGGIVPLSEQSLKEGNRLRFIALTGNLSTRGIQSAITTDAQSTGAQSVVVTGDGGPLTISFQVPETVDAAEWVAGFSSEIEQPGSQYPAVSAADSTVTVKLDPSKTYVLKLAEVSVDTDQNDPADQDSTADYIIAADGGSSVVSSGKNTTLVAEARDKFNNAVPGTNVTFEITSGDATFVDDTGEEISSNSTTVFTNGEGLAPQKLRIDAIGNDVTVTATLSNKSGPLNTTTFRIETPRESNPVDLAGVSFNGVSSANTGQDTISLSFQNINPEASRNITKFRMDFYQGQDPPNSGSISDESGNSDSFQVGGSATTTRLFLPPDQETIVEIQFNGGNMQSNDWFIVTVQYGNGDTGQYFVTVP